MSGSSVLPRASVCTWYGVKCDANRRVSKLELTYNDLTGSIPESIGKLTALTDLDLSFNHLNGSIPDSIGQLTCGAD